MLHPETGRFSPEEYHDDDPPQEATADSGSEVKEKSASPNIKFVITDHNLRYPEKISLEQQRVLYREMKGHGISAIRFDWDWKEVAPEPNARNTEAENRYIEAMRIMKEEGLEAPVLVLSNPPEWAAKLYKEDKEAFFMDYEQYIRSLAEALKASGLEINSAQLFNEINHAVLFKFIDISDLHRAAKIARQELAVVQPDVKLSTSLIVSNVNDFLAKKSGQPTSLDLLDNNAQMLKESFDLVSIDYYPGVWHRPEWLPKNAYKQLDALKEIFERLDNLDLDYEIDEVGFPSNLPYNTEKNQRYFYDVFFKEFRKMLMDLKSKGVRMPKWVGLYETQDEANITFGGPIEKALKIPGISHASKLLPNPEHDFGLKNQAGEPKGILKGKRAGPKKKFTPKKFKSLKDGEISRLSEIIRYVNRPIETKTSLEKDETEN